VEFVSPFTLSVDREISGSRKPYFADHGILQIMQAQPRGTLLENAVMTELRVIGRKIQYYQKRNGKEIDFILDF
jgi:predicted AAA+ superfamily ATPase